MRQQQLQHWQRVRMSAYHTLGNMIATLEALERGDPVETREMAPGTQGEAATPAERYVCLKAACRLLLVAIERSIEMVCSRRVGMSEDLVVCEVRLETGEEVLDRLANMGGDRRN